MPPRIGDSGAHVERALHEAVARLASPATHNLFWRSAFRLRFLSWCARWLSWWRKRNRAQRASCAGWSSGFSLRYLTWWCALVVMVA